MKDSVAVNANEKWLFWIIDPIESFIDGGEGEKYHALVIPIPGATPRILHDPVLWKLGKRAFDILASKLDREITRKDIDDFFYDSLGDLVELWNEHADILGSRIEGGHIPMINLNSKDSITDYASIYVDQTDPWTAYGHRIEPFIRLLDNIIEAVNLEQRLDDWPYDRELLAAYFTLCHIDNSAVRHALDNAYKDDYELARYWFDKVDSYQRKRDAIDRYVTFSKWEKSDAGNQVRHAKTNKAKRLVIDNFSKGPTEFGGGAQAGRFYAEWLEGMGYKFEVETITKWIREFAKENGIKLR